MKKVFALVVLVLFAATTAIAKTPTEKAIGYDGGLSFRYYTGSIGIQGIPGLELDSPASDNLDTAVDLNIGVNVFTCLQECDRGNLNCFGGVEIDPDGDTRKNSDTETDISLMAGLEPEIFLLDNLSVTTKFGVKIMIEGDERSAATGKTVDDTGSFKFGTFGNKVSIIEGVAFNWYF